MHGAVRRGGGMRARGAGGDDWLRRDDDLDGDRLEFGARRGLDRLDRDHGQPDHGRPADGRADNRGRPDDDGRERDDIHVDHHPRELLERRCQRHRRMHGRPEGGDLQRLL